MPSLLEQFLPLALCIGGLVLVARYVHVRNRDAGNSWRYIYWQPWRVWGMSIVGGAFLLLLLIFTVIAWLE